MNKDFVTSLLLENCTTFKDRNEVHALTESQHAKVSNVVLSNLYKSIIEKGHVDFESIPVSRGRISKYDGLENMLASLQIVDEIANKTTIKVPEVKIIQDAIANIEACGDLFEKGFRYDKEFIMMTYSSLVLACVESTSGILSSYIDFMKRPDQIQFKVLDPKGKPYAKLITILDNFNNSVKSGEFRRTMAHVLETEGNNLVGMTATAAIGKSLVFLGGLALIIPAIREIIFMFYYSRMRVSEYLKQQAMFVNAHRVNVEMNAAIPARKKQEILKKQEKMINDLNKISEKIRVDYAVSSNKANAEIAGANKKFTLNDTQASASSMDGGFNLL